MRRIQFFTGVLNRIHTVSLTASDAEKEWHGDPQRLLALDKKAPALWGREREARCARAVEG
jgi:hypothetical protein